MRIPYRSAVGLVHDVIGEWECEYGYDINAQDRYLLAQMLTRAFADEYGTTRIKNDHYTLIPADPPLEAA